jgi:hypothetical protein
VKKTLQYEVSSHEPAKEPEEKTARAIDTFDFASTPSTPESQQSPDMALRSLLKADARSKEKKPAPLALTDPEPAAEPEQPAAPVLKLTTKSERPAPEAPITTGRERPEETDLRNLIRRELGEEPIPQRRRTDRGMQLVTPSDDYDDEVAQAEADLDLESFAKKVGAASLPELLEASAAYTTIVKGRTRFSRAHIMSMLEEVSEEKNYTQEARIKSFGKLLRNGTIVRVEDGQFSISHAAKYTYESKIGAA